MKELKDFSKEELIELLKDSAKNWLAHDGLWFQAVEKECGIDKAIKLDAEAWEQFTVIEAQRIMKRHPSTPLGINGMVSLSNHNIKPNGGITALIQALNFRLYAYINRQEITEVSNSRCVFRMNECRVQETRKRKNLPDFPCKPVGLVEYTNFAMTIDPRIKTKCIACPPDSHPPESWCAWEFSI